MLIITSAGELLSCNTLLPWRLDRQIGDVESEHFSDRVTALAFTADGNSLVVGSGPPSRFGDIKIVDVADSAIVKDLGEPHSDTVYGLEISPDGRTIASAGADKICRLYDVETASLSGTLEGHTHHILSTAWQDDSKVLATASADGTIKIWNIDTGMSSRTINVSSQEVTKIRFVGQTPNLLASSLDGSVRMYDTNNGRLLRDFGRTTGALFSLDVSSDQAYVIAGGDAGAINAWKISDGKKVVELDGIPSRSNDK